MALDALVAGYVFEIADLIIIIKKKTFGSVAAKILQMVFYHFNAYLLIYSTK